MNGKILLLSFTLLLLALGSGAEARADQASESRERFHDALIDCSGQLGLETPAKGKERPELTADQRAELKDCLARQGVQLPSGDPASPGRKFHAQVKACLAEAGVAMPDRDPASTEKPALNEEQKSALAKCRQDVLVQFRGDR